jgi:hypothetical protein
MNARDKMPFEGTPIFYKLQRYEAANATPPAAPAPSDQPAQPAAGQPQATTFSKLCASILRRQ